MLGLSLQNVLRTDVQKRTSLFLLILGNHERFDRMDQEESEPVIPTGMCDPNLHSIEPTPEGLFQVLLQYLRRPIQHIYVRNE